LASVISRLGEPSSPERGHPSPKGEVLRLGYNYNDMPQAPTRQISPLFSLQQPYMHTQIA